MPHDAWMLDSPDAPNSFFAKPSLKSGYQAKPRRGAKLL